MRKLIFLLFLLFPLLANAQIVVRNRPLHVPTSGGIAFGASTRGDESSGAATSLTFDSPSVSGSNTLAVVILTTRGAQPVSGVTWNSVSMTENVASYNNNGGTQQHVFYLVAPAAGVTSVVISASAAWGGIFADASYYTGVNQSTPVDTGGAGTGASSTTYAPTATTNNANEYVIAQASLPNACSIPAADSPAVSSQSGCDGTFSWRSAYMSVASASTPTFSWTVGTANTWSWNWISIRPA